MIRHISETIFDLSNGHLGLRGNRDEGDPVFQPIIGPIPQED